MKKTIIIAFIGIFVLIALPAQADLVELDLLSLGCPTEFDFQSSPWSYNFDLGVQFSSIDHVYMDWSGQITAGLYFDQSDPIQNPQPIGVGLISEIGIHPETRKAEVGGGSTYPDPESFDLLTEFVEGTMPWSELYDGQGNIRIQYWEPILPMNWYIEHGSVNLEKANLLVNGVVIPEPSSFLLLILGGMTIQKTRKRK